MAREITWVLSCGCSYKTGERIDFDKALLHHIRHNKFGDTLYGGFYDTLKNLACLKGDKEKSEVEGADLVL